eukprot:6492730-Amphidinium_carterae.8
MTLPSVGGVAPPPLPPPPDQDEPLALEDVPGELNIPEGAGAVERLRMVLRAQNMHSLTCQRTLSVECVPRRRQRHHTL